MFSEVNPFLEIFCFSTDLRLQRGKIHGIFPYKWNFKRHFLASFTNNEDVFEKFHEINLLQPPVMVAKGKYPLQP